MLLPDIEIEASYDSESSAADKNDSPPPVKKRGKNVHLCTIGEYSSLAELEANIATLGNFKLRRSRPGSKQTSLFYTCRNVKTRGSQCASSLKAVAHSPEKFILMESGNEHTCGSSNNTALMPMSELQRDVIHDLFMQNSRVTNGVVVNHFLLKNIPLPTKWQISSLLVALRKGQFESNTPTAGEMEQFFLENSDIPSDPSQLFVAAYHLSVGKEVDMRFFVTTVKLLEQAKDVNLLCADATYKLLWHKFPILVVGTTDLNQHFHLLGISIGKHQDATNYSFLFQSLKDAVFKTHGWVLAPSVLVSDSAAAIRNGFKEVFGSCQHVMCWFHVKKNIMDKIKSLKSLNVPSELVTDIDTLQRCRTPAMFSEACVLYNQKWSGFLPFTEYLNTSWISQNANWYEGCIDRAPKTNNALESFNGRIKSAFSFHVRATLPQFLRTLEELISTESKKYLLGLKKFTTQPEVPANLWKKGYTWINLKPDLEKIDHGTGFFYRFDAKDPPKPYSEYFSYSTGFDNFKAENFSSWLTYLEHHEKNWKASFCTCPFFFKKNICKHIVGLAIGEKLTEVPAVAKAIPIDNPRPAGRNKKTTSALNLQN